MDPLRGRVAFWHRLKRYGTVMSGPYCYHVALEELVEVLSLVPGQPVTFLPALHPQHGLRATAVRPIERVSVQER